MDIFYNKTVTIFNRCADDILGDDTWYPTVLHNVRLIEGKGANITATGLADADSAKLFINTETLEKAYLSPIAWQKSAEKAKFFTLASDMDFFVVGDVQGEVPPTSGSFLNAMRRKYDGVYRITTVDKYELIPHFEVGGE